MILVFTTGESIGPTGGTFPSSHTVKKCSALSFSNGVTVRSLMVCSGLRKCSATPDLSTFLLIMSHLCSLNLPFSCLLVCLMYWQFLCSFVKQCLHCKA